MTPETAFVLNTFSLLLWGALVMWMCAGFTMLESGSVRSKNASVICMKNVGAYATTAIVFYVVGYNLMYTGVGQGGWIGSPTLLYGATGPSGHCSAATPRRPRRSWATAGPRWPTGCFRWSSWVRSPRSCGDARRAGQATLVPAVHRHTGGIHLSRDRVLDLGRRLAGRDGVPGSGGFDGRPLDGRLGRARRRSGGGFPAGQIPARRDGQADAAEQRTHGDSRRLHRLAGVSRVQRRLPRRTDWGPRMRSR